MPKRALMLTKKQSISAVGEEKASQWHFSLAITRAFSDASPIRSVLKSGRSPACVCLRHYQETTRAIAEALFLSLVRSQFPFQGYKFVSNARAGEH